MTKVLPFPANPSLKYSILISNSWKLDLQTLRFLFVLNSFFYNLFRNYSATCSCLYFSFGIHRREKIWNKFMQVVKAHIIMLHQRQIAAPFVIWRTLFFLLASRGFLLANGKTWVALISVDEIPWL
jgi:hypothetical protein